LQKLEPENKTGSLLLIPSSLGEGSDFYSAEVKEKIFRLEFFIVENERSARRFLRSIGYRKNFDEGTMMRVESDSVFAASPVLLSHLQAGKEVGVLSEAGAPGIADPGSAAVRWAHQHGVKVVPLVGPSSVFLALMGSGLNGQQFCFHGYLPVPSPERKKKIRQLEEESQRKNQTQIFMETPYRNDALLKDLLETLQPATLLCIACSLTLGDELIRTQPVAAWKKHFPALNRRPAIFLLLG
jgi:16S rRNA (cytidine1402-2'-O)-methyltransferase